MKAGSAFLLVPLLLLASTVARAQPAYNEVRQKSAHNAYQRYEAVLDQLVYHRVRSLEFDIHNGKSGWSKVAGDWFVYHDDDEPQTTCHRFSDCLNELRAFHLANPNHEVVTVWVDLKDAFETGRMPQDLDTRITTHLDPTWLFKPSDLLADCADVTSLQAAVTGACGWRSTANLRGRFIIVLTGGDVSTTSTKLNTYVANGATATSRRAFIAPDLFNTSAISAKNYVVFFNMQSPFYTSLASDVYLAGFISRVWDVNTEAPWDVAVAETVNHIGTNKVNYLQDSWAVTHNGLGWPFGCIETWPCGGYQEAVDVIGAEVDSGDLWNGSDSFFFASESTSAVATTTWTATVSTPNSHVDEWAKGCLMARAGTAANARYFAVCRPADNHKLRIQYRTATGGATSSAEVDIVPADTIDQESLSFIRLTVQYDGTQTCASGYGSQDGAAWKLIGSKCLSGLLDRHGLAVSSHGGGKVKLLFSNVKKNGTLYRQASFPTKTAVGTGVTGTRLFDGVL